MMEPFLKECINYMNIKNGIFETIKIYKVFSHYLKVVGENLGHTISYGSRNFTHLAAARLRSSSIAA